MISNASYGEIRAYLPISPHISPLSASYEANLSPAYGATPSTVAEMPEYSAPTPRSAEMERLRAEDADLGAGSRCCAASSEHRVKTRGCECREYGGTRPNTAEYVSSRVLVGVHESVFCF